MATYVPPKKSTAYIIYVGLPDSALAYAYKSNPTLAAGDAKVSIDGGALANLTTLPAVTPASSKMVKISLSTSEMNGDNITVVLSDQTAPPEWADVIVNIPTSARQVDDLAFPNTSGRGMDVDASGGVEVGSFQAGAITAAAIASDAITDAKVASDVTIASVTGAVGSVTGNVGGNVTGSVGSVATGGITAGSIAADAIGASELATDAVTEIVSAVWAAAARTLTTLDEDSTTLDLDATIRAAVGMASANLDTQLTTIDDFLDTEVAAIKAKTDSLTFTTANRVDAQVFGMQANVMTAAAAASDLTTELQTGLATATSLATLQTSVDDLPTNAELATALGTADDAVLAQVALVKAKTDNLPSDPADQSIIIAATDAILTAVGDVPTNAELATALASADDAVLAQVALVKAKTDSLAFTVAGQVDANIQYVNDVQVTGDGSAGTPWGP